MRATLQQKIIDLLAAEATFVVKTIYFSLPIKVLDYPYAAVVWASSQGPNIEQTTKLRALQRIDFSIQIVDRSRVVGNAEKSVETLVEIAHGVLFKNPTLDGIVEDSYPVEVQPIEPIVQDDWAIAGAILKVACFFEVNA
jgi:hypothetical protein